MSIVDKKTIRTFKIGCKIKIEDCEKDGIYDQVIEDAVSQAMIGFEAEIRARIEQKFKLNRDSQAYGRLRDPGDYSNPPKINFDYTECSLESWKGTKF